MIKQTVFMDDPGAQTLIQGVALGEIEPDAEGSEVFRFLKQDAWQNVLRLTEWPNKGVKLAVASRGRVSVMTS